MHHHQRSNAAATFVLVAMLAVGLVPAALADDQPPSQPSTIERLVRQEDARRAELARYDVSASQGDLSRMRDAGATATSVVVPARGRDDGFAWRAAVLGLCAGVALMCVLLGCVTLVRHEWRVHSV